MRLLVVFIVFLTSGCSQEFLEEPTSIHPDFRQDFELFVTEAQFRGVALDTSGLVIRYSSDLSSSTCGQCRLRGRSNERDRTVEINQVVTCWQNDREKEALVFHELGHCLLGRDHVQDTLPNGSPKSLMISGNISVYGPCVYAIGDVEDCNFIHRRDYYIDELFDPTVSAPDWALSSQ